MRDTGRDKRRLALLELHVGISGGASYHDYDYRRGDRNDHQRVQVGRHLLAVAGGDDGGRVLAVVALLLLPVVIWVRAVEGCVIEREEKEKKRKAL